MSNLKHICFYPSSESFSVPVKNALARLVPVRFTDSADLGQCKAVDAVIDLSEDANALNWFLRENVRCFHFGGERAEARPNAGEPRVQFGNSPHLDSCFRGRSIWHKPVEQFCAVPIGAGDEVLANYGSEPIWVRRSQGGAAVDMVSVPAPRLREGERPFDYLDSYHFIQLLPLLHFLRTVAADIGWTAPSLRACLMFDDPNLHWTSYGFLSYKEVVARAKRDRYHVSFATVPLDAWGANSQAAALFRENPGQLSLLIHGNNHSKAELGQRRKPDENLALMARSLRRIENLELKTGLHVDRAIVPPHEALADTALESLISLGIEGACLTPWSLKYWNKQHQWSSSFGMELAEMVDASFPVIARFDLSGPWDGPVALSAFLGRPIVLFEHHEAVAAGIDLLSQAAATINSLGKVEWCGLQQMLRSNFITRRDGTTLHVKPYSSRIVFEIPTGITSLAVVPPNDDPKNGSFARVLVRGHNGSKASIRVSAGSSVPVTPGERIELVSPVLGRVDYRQVDPAGFPLGAFARRIICETRDRMLPLLPKKRDGGADVRAAE